jgi:hypothetical protein|tara:strand:- start:475 stop:678 length:204 start_codon:yes stop_codon:yes gene_type:complete
MAWYNINSSDKITAETLEKKHEARCIFCGRERPVHVIEKIYFSDMEMNEGPMCKECHHTHAKKAIAS